ncbi:DNA polymerase III subunit alpha [Metabacillus herbersteinensis]|uniref:DNA polymerase III subunit alpha n=1 Tax=Metabacillus herbersteinensis TaxID=283816 RepID=A0ABV6G9Y3_9BACI
MPFVHLQVQSAYSLLNSAAKLDKLVQRAKELQFNALAITDFHVMYGAIAFYKLCQKYGVKPVIGLTASIKGDHEESTPSYPLILLAENNQGYQNLLKISSVLQTKSPEGLPEKWLKRYSNGLVAITPGVSGLVEQLLLQREEEQAILTIKNYQSIFGRNSFYVGIQNHQSSEGKLLLDSLVRMSKLTEVPLVVTNDVKYIEKDDAFAHRCVLAIKNGTKLSEDNHDSEQGSEYYLKPATEMVSLFENYPDALENTLNIAKRCNVTLELGTTHLPSYPTPENTPADEYLERLCYDGLKQRFQQPEDTYYKRLTYELDIIKKMKFSDYFLIVWDFMKYAHEKGILTGPGRGSAAGSLISYILKITDVDPVKHRLLFERFLNPERISMPDIDIDFPDNRRDEVIDYVANKYGKLHVAQIITFGTLAAKASIRDIGRVMGVSGKDADFLSKQIPSRPGITLQEAVKESANLRKALDENELLAKIFHTAMKIEGLPRHVSTHAAGVVLSEQPLTEVIPIQDGQNGIYLTQYSMDFLEDIGLLKMDFLGLRNLTLIDAIKHSVEKAKGIKIDFSKESYEDSKTFELLSKGDTTGVFQLESEGMRSVLRRLKPTNLEDIVAVNALFRPGPMENIPSFISRKHKEETVHYLHSDLEPILKTTHGVIVYQEQIMEIASTMAGFSLGEADLLRRAVGKKKKEILDKERDHFVAGCIAKGYREQIAHNVYDLIVKFANYGFNRSHAVAYSMVAYQLAYLKAHYPLYFMAALLTSVNGNDDKIAQYVREAKQMQLIILPPSINESAYPFLVEKEAIRYSLAAIKNVGVAAIKEIFHARKNKRFADLFDFCVRVSTKAVNRRTLESLVFSGAMDEFNVDRATLLASLDVALEHSELFSSDEDNQFDLFLEEELTLKPKYVEVEAFKIEDKLKFEKEALGFYFSSHPVAPLRPALQQLGAKSIIDLSQQIARKVKTAGFITAFKTIRTKKGEVMAFLEIGDESGEVEAVIFPTTYTKHSELLKQGVILLFEGKMESRDDRKQLIIQHVQPPSNLSVPSPKTKLFLKIDERSLTEGKLHQVKLKIKEFKGSTPVYLYYEEEKKTVQLQGDYLVFPTTNCLNQLKDVLGEANVVLKEE